MCVFAMHIWRSRVTFLALDLRSSSCQQAWWQVLLPVKSSHCPTWLDFSVNILHILFLKAIYMSHRWQESHYSYFT